MGWLDFLETAYDMLTKDPSEAINNAVQRQLMKPKAPQKAMTVDNKLTVDEIRRAAEGHDEVEFFKVSPREYIHVCPGEVTVGYYDSSKNLVHTNTWPRKELIKNMESDILYSIWENFSQPSKLFSKL